MNFGLFFTIFFEMNKSIEKLEKSFFFVDDTINADEKTNKWSNFFERKRFVRFVFSQICDQER